MIRKDGIKDSETNEEHLACSIRFHNNCRHCLRPEKAVFHWVRISNMRQKFFQIIVRYTVNTELSHVRPIYMN